MRPLNKIETCLDLVASLCPLFGEQQQLYQRAEERLFYLICPLQRQLATQFSIAFELSYLTLTRSRLIKSRSFEQVVVSPCLSSCVIQLSQFKTELKH